MVLGDSLSAAYGLEVDRGWVQLLQQRLDVQGFAYRVINASLSGDTTRGALQRLPQALTQHRPSLVIVELGGNDGLRGLPLDEMATNLRQIVERSQRAGAQVLLVGMQLPPNYGPQYVTRFAQTYANVAQATGTPLAPFLLEGIGTDINAFQSDGIHPSATSQPQLLDNVWPYLEPLLRRAAAPQASG
jgi:acyl-CoA thioesterase-1